MKNYIKTLEKLGQSTSIQQYENLNELIGSQSIDDITVKRILSDSKELICAHMPGDDDED